MSDEKLKRLGKLVSISQAIQNTELEVKGATFANWTDEQWAEHDARIAASRQRERQVDARGRLAAAGFPLRAIEVAQSARDDEPLIQRVKNWNTETTSVLVISGSKGCGKTVAATWWAAKQSRTPIFVRASTFAASSRYDRDTRVEWFSAPAMVLDDLGAEYLDGKGSFMVDLDELIDVYYGDKRPLLITTNCPKDATKERPGFRERYGERVYDRLKECGSWFETNSDSRRGRRP